MGVLSHSAGVMESSEAPVLHEDRLFDPDPTLRRVARELYEGTRDLPIVSPHGHVDPRMLADNEPFPEPTALLVTPDHYIFRMLYSQGISLEALGIPSRDGAAVESDPRKVWQIFGEHWYLFRGTPTGTWVAQELVEVFGVRKKLSGATAQAIYDEINEKLQSPEFRPRALFERFNIEVLTTTDGATDPLEQHRRIRESGWKGKVVPAFRPDAVMRIATPGWGDELEKLAAHHGAPITDFATFIRALEDRRAYFKTFGATSTDHGVYEPRTEAVPAEVADALFQKARNRLATAEDQRRFEAKMLMEMARMSVEDGMVMQIHPGSFRDHNERVYARFGNDKGADIPVATEYTRNLRPLLSAYGNDPRLTIVLFTLDESTYARELAPLAGHYPALRLGPSWWFHDSPQGMMRFREQVTETAGIYNTVGFNDDTRAFCSIPARHDVARRMDANFLAGLVARHMIDMNEAHEMARALAYDLVRKAYKLDGSMTPATNGKQ